MRVTKHLPEISLILIGHLVPYTVSSTIAVNQECVSAIYSIIGNLNFEGIGYGDYYTGVCQNPLKVISIYAIAKTYCAPADLQPGIDYLNWACQNYGEVELMPIFEVAVNLTEESIRTFPILQQSDEDNTRNLTTPILISRSWFDLGFRTEDAWDFELRTHTAYGFAMYGFWGGVLVIGMLHRFIAVLQERRLLIPSTSAEDTGLADARATSARWPKNIRSLYSWVNQHLVTPSAFSPYRRELLFGCTIPTRLESFVILSYWLISFILCCVNYRGFEGNLYWSAVSPQIWRYLADRTGIIAYANLPLVWMFSGRNNIFIWLTGWQFSTFNLFHKHIARIATVQAIFHSIGYTAFYFTGGFGDSYRESFQEPWWYLGVVGTIAMSFLVLFSFSWFRRKIYESFLLLHIILSVVVIVALFYHTSIFDGEYNPYLWPLVAIWSFDRFLRIIRVIYCNLHVRLRKKSLHRSVATIAYDKDTDIVRISIKTHITPGPGQHYYLYQPFRFKGWENHPFTLAYWNQPIRRDLPISDATQLETPMESQENSGVTSSGVPEPTLVEGEHLLSFWIRPYDGWTRRLRDECLQSGLPFHVSPSFHKTILLEGPYGRAEPLWTFDEVLLIAGGSGIAALVPYVLEQIARASPSDGQPIRTLTRTVTLVWINRKEALIRRVVQQELATALQQRDFTAAFYCTGGLADGLISLSPATFTDALPRVDASKEISVGRVLAEKDETEVSGKTGGVRGAGFVAIHPGRPDITAMIETAAMSAAKCGSRLAVMSCGPAGLADTAREATYSAMRQSGGTIKYVEEAFGW